MRLDVILGAGYRARLDDSREVLIRAARSSDERPLQAFVGGLWLVSRYQRFFLSLRELPSAMLDHLLRPDTGAEAALLALDAHGDVTIPVKPSLPTGNQQVGFGVPSGARKVGVQ